MKPLFFLAAIVLILLTAQDTVRCDVAVLEQYYAYIQGQDTDIFAANVFSQDTERLRFDASASLGTRDVTNNFLNFADTSVRMNSMSELLVTMAALKLVQDSVFSSLDATIPNTYMPRGLSFFNPAHPGTPLTLRHLMTHTSTLNDAEFEKFRTTSPTAVVTFRSFIEAYFLGPSTGGTYTVSSSIWKTATPGLATSYHYAKANIALLAFVVEQAVVTRPTLVDTGSTPTVATYIQEKILDPLGMSDTYLRGLTGAFPDTSYPAGSPLFTGKAVVDYTSAGSVMANTIIHPAYPADYMYYTTVSDIGRLMRALFLDVENGPWITQGTLMKNNPITLTASSSVTLMTAQKLQGQGLMFFDGAAMCAIALASAAVTECPLKSESLIWGYQAVGAHSQTGTFCSDTDSSIKPTCVSVTLSYRDTGTDLKTMNYLLGFAAVGFQEAIGTKTSGTQQPVEDTSKRLYLLWVAMGISGVILFVFVASFITENLIQPAPVSAGVPVPTAVPTY